MSIAAEDKNKKSQFERYYRYQSRMSTSLGLLKVLSNRSTNARIFMKELEYSDKESFCKDLKRFKTRIQSKNPFFVEFYDFADVFKTDKLQRVYRLRVFIEYFDCSLEQKIREVKSSGEPMSYEQIARLTYFLLKAGNFLQSQKKCHGDIRPSNILFTEKGHIKFLERLTNLQLSFPYNQIQTSKQNESDAADLYICPSLHKSLKHKKKLPVTFDIQKSEVFSAGLCILEVGVGRSIQGIYLSSDEGINVNELSTLMKEFCVNYLKSPLLIQTLASMLQPFENDRKGYGQLLEHFPGVQAVLNQIGQENVLESSKYINYNDLSSTRADFLESQKTIMSTFQIGDETMLTSNRFMHRLESRRPSNSADIALMTHRPSNRFLGNNLATLNGHFGERNDQTKTFESNKNIFLHPKLDASDLFDDMSVMASNRSILTIDMRSSRHESFLVPPQVNNLTADKTPAFTRNNSQQKGISLYRKQGEASQLSTRQANEAFPSQRTMESSKRIVPQLPLPQSKKSNRNFSMDPRMGQNHVALSPSIEAQVFSKIKKQIYIVEETEANPEDIQRLFGLKQSPVSKPNHFIAKESKFAKGPVRTFEITDEDLYEPVQPKPSVTFQNYDMRSAKLPMHGYGSNQHQIDKPSIKEPIRPYQPQMLVMQGQSPQMIFAKQPQRQNPQAQEPVKVMSPFAKANNAIHFPPPPIMRESIQQPAQKMPQMPMHKPPQQVHHQYPNAVLVSPNVQHLHHQVRPERVSNSPSPMIRQPVMGPSNNSRDVSPNLISPQKAFINRQKPLEASRHMAPTPFIPVPDIRQIHHQHTNSMQIPAPHFYSTPKNIETGPDPRINMNGYLSTDRPSIYYHHHSNSTQMPQPSIQMNVRPSDSMRMSGLGPHNDFFHPNLPKEHNTPDRQNHRQTNFFQTR